jgi:hypothetical protein
MAAYDIYGMDLTNIVNAKDLMESLLGVNFEERESDYQAGIYYRAGCGSEENFVIKKNLDPYDGEPVEPQFQEYKILLYINNTLRSLKLQNTISVGNSKVVLLRHSER